MKDGAIYLFANHNGPLLAYAPPRAPATQGQKAFLSVPSSTFKAKITDQDSSHRWQEFYYGSSYLSQQSRTLLLTGKEARIVLVDFTGIEQVVCP